jgi:hypothetical protein
VITERTKTKRARSSDLALFSFNSDHGFRSRCEAPSLDRWHLRPSDLVLLQSGEPNFYIIGIKNYGRDAGFLMQNGLRQVRNAYRLISGDDSLDLYDGALS